jgi:hypothetical protein
MSTAGETGSLGSFSDPGFVAHAAAARFFAEHTEAEVQRKLDDLASLQVAHRPVGFFAHSFLRRTRMEC